MQKKLALIELHHHSEVLRTFAQLFLHLGWQINVFTNQQVKSDCYELAKLPKIQWQLRGKENAPSFLQQQRLKIDECDLAIFVTLMDSQNFPIAALKPKTILIIHNGNTFFDAKNHWSIAKQFPQIFKDFGKLIFFYLMREGHRRIQLVHAFDFVSLAGSSMMNYFSKEEKWNKKYHSISPLPFTFFEELPERALIKKTIVTIGIPGTIRGEGRDYKKILAAFRQIIPELKQEVKLIFLGGAQSKYARKLIKEFQLIENENFKIQYSPGFILQEDFDQQLRAVDFLILPLKESYRLGIIREVYGHTNISGGINDMIRFGIPALISQYYPLESPLSEMTKTYKSVEDLSQLLLRWIEEKTFRGIREKATQLLKAHEKEVLAKKLELQINAIL